MNTEQASKIFVRISKRIMVKKLTQFPIRYIVLIALILVYDIEKSKISHSEISIDNEITFRKASAK